MMKQSYAWAKAPHGARAVAHLVREPVEDHGMSLCSRFADPGRYSKLDTDTPLQKCRNCVRVGHQFAEGKVSNG